MPKSQELLRNCLSLMVASYPNQKPLTEDNVRAYGTLLQEIPDNQFEQAIRDAMEASTDFLPSVPAILKAWKARAAKVDNLAADQEWDRIIKFVDANLFADPQKPPEGLSDAAQYALRQIGDVYAIYNLAFANDEEQLRWLGKSFRDAYNRHAETGGLKAIGREEAKRMLDVARNARKQLEAAQAQSRPLYRDAPKGAA